MRRWRVEKGGGMFQLYSICCVIWGLVMSWRLLAVHGVVAPISVSTHLALCLQTWHSTAFYCLDTTKAKINLKTELPNN